MLGFIDGIDLYNKKLAQKHRGSVSTYPRKSRTTGASIVHGLLRSSVVYRDLRGPDRQRLHIARDPRPRGRFPATRDRRGNGNVHLKVRLCKYSHSSTGRILGLKGGSSCLPNVIQTYRKGIKRFAAPGKQQPVIMLIDNDKGAAGVYSALRDITKLKIDGSQSIIHAFANLYVVPTPLAPGGMPSKIEDFFDDSVKSAVVAGKTFNAEEGADPSLHYGKMVFAHKVVRRMQTRSTSADSRTF